MYVACYRVANTDMCKLHATRGVYVKMGYSEKYVKMGCSEKYVKVGCSEKYVKIGCSSMLTFTKAGKVDGARQGGRDFCQAIVFLTVSLQFDCSG